MKLDPNEIVPPEVLTESFHHPEVGWLDFDPRTLVIKQPAGRKPVSWPIAMVGQFIGTNQPNIPSCGYPEPGKNMGCPKALECPVLRAVQQIRPGMTNPHIGPFPVIAKNKGAISHMKCTDFFSVHNERGNLVFQTNYSEQGWKLDTSRTTVPVLSANPQFNVMGQKTHNQPIVWEKYIPFLGPYWWPLMKKQGRELPEPASRFPEFVGEDEEEECTTSPQPESLPSSSLVGAKKPSRKARTKRAGTASPSVPGAGKSGASQGQDA